MAKGLELLELAGQEPQKVILVRSDVADVAKQGQERRLGSDLCRRTRGPWEADDWGILRVVFFCPWPLFDS
jgi:hypothetical protein